MAPTAAAMLGFGSPAFAQPGLGAKPRSRMRADESGGSPPATVARVGTAMVTSMAPSAAARGQGPSNAGSPCPHPRQPSEWRRPPAPIIQITYGAPARPAVLARAVAVSNTAPPAAPCPSVAAPAVSAERLRNAAGAIVAVRRFRPRDLDLWRWICTCLGMIHLIKWSKLYNQSGKVMVPSHAVQDWSVRPFLPSRSIRRTCSWTFEAQFSVKVDGDQILRMRQVK